MITKTKNNNKIRITLEIHSILTFRRYMYLMRDTQINGVTVSSLLFSWFIFKKTKYDRKQVGAWVIMNWGAVYWFENRSQQTVVWVDYHLQINSTDYHYVHVNSRSQQIRHNDSYFIFVYGCEIISNPTQKLRKRWNDFPTKISGV